MPDRKISEAFDASLRRSAPNRRIRAMAMLAVPIPTGVRAERVRDTKMASDVAIRAIDELFHHIPGRRLAEPNALGYVPVESTPEGIRALARCEHVRALIEDQPIQLAR